MLKLLAVLWRGLHRFHVLICVLHRVIFNRYFDFSKHLWYRRSHLSLCSSSWCIYDVPRETSEQIGLLRSTINQFRASSRNIAQWQVALYCPWSCCYVLTRRTRIFLRLLPSELSHSHVTSIGHQTWVFGCLDSRTCRWVGLQVREFTLLECQLIVLL